VEICQSACRSRLPLDRLPERKKVVVVEWMMKECGSLDGGRSVDGCGSGRASEVAAYLF
jgi:hypothetical protein